LLAGGIGRCNRQFARRFSATTQLETGSEEELMSAVEPNHSLLMKLLVIRHLRSLLARSPALRTGLQDVEELVLATAAPVLGVSDLAGKMLPSCYPDSIAPEKIPIRALSPKLSGHSEHLRVLDLS
jgi:hypothetical protein